MPDPLGNYSTQLPNGTFAVQLTQELLSTLDFSTLSTALGSGVVSGTTTLNFAAPTITTADLSGTVSFTGSSIPSVGASLTATDISAPPPTTTSFGFGSLPTTGAYDFILGTGDKYLVGPTVQVPLLPTPAPLGFFTPPDPISSPNPLTGNTVRNIIYPMFPGPATGFTISGRVTTTSSGAPVPNVSITAGSTVLSVDPNTSFAQTATTDAHGNYSMLVAAGTYTLLFQPGPAAVGDFDGDGMADKAVWRPSTGQWFIIPSGNPGTPIIQSFGLSGDVVVPGDYDGDRKTDTAVFRPSTGQWFVTPSSNPGTPIVQQWGLASDIPVQGDYDGDGKTDFAVWRPSTGQWLIIPSSNPGTPIVKQLGLAGDIPVQGDYDGDGKTDFAVWRPSTGQWFVIPSSNPGTPIIQSFGLSGDVPVPGDYDGDGKTDFALWRPSTGQWFVMPSGNPGTPIIHSFGLAGDVPVPRDYDGDGTTDFAVWRPATGQWFIIPSSNPSSPTVTSWGLPTDVPVQKPIGQ